MSMFVGLVRDPGWQPPEGFPEPGPEPGRSWRIPWRAVIWVAVLIGLLRLVPVVEDAFGPLVGYGLLVATVSLGVWRFDRWCGRLYWRGLRDYQS
jgi:hypothetical protein